MTKNICLNGWINGVAPTELKWIGYSHFYKGLAPTELEGLLIIKIQFRKDEIFVTKEHSERFL